MLLFLLLLLFLFCFVLCLFDCLFACFFFLFCLFFVCLCLFVCLFYAFVFVYFVFFFSFSLAHAVTQCSQAIPLVLMLITSVLLHHAIFVQKSKNNVDLSCIRSSLEYTPSILKRCTLSKRLHWVFKGEFFILILSCKILRTKMPLELVVTLKQNEHCDWYIRC